jgi:hypothetical protein
MPREFRRRINLGRLVHDRVERQRDHGEAAAPFSKGEGPSMRSSLPLSLRRLKAKILASSTP